MKLIRFGAAGAEFEIAVALGLHIALKQAGEDKAAVRHDRPAGVRHRIGIDSEDRIADQLQLAQLPRLADYRNKVGGHASGERPDKGTTLEYSEFAIEWMRLFESWY